jgi:hypothetical protein
LRVKDADNQSHKSCRIGNPVQNETVLQVNEYDDHKYARVKNSDCELGAEIVAP